MENAMAVALILGPIYLLSGLSMLIYPKQWKKVINGWEKDHFALLPMLVMSMVLGLIIIQMYSVWEWNVWALVTVSGWAMFLKGAAYLLLPGSLLKSALAMKKSTAMVYLGGLVGTAAGAALTYYSYMA